MTKLQSKVIFILGLLFILVMGCTEPKLTTGSQKDVKYVIVNYQGTSMRLDAEKNAEFIQRLYKEVSSTILQNQPIPNEMNSQTSEALFTILLGYGDKSEDLILSTETGKFIYKNITGNGWMGGPNNNVIKVVQDIFRREKHDITYINEKYGFSLVFPQTWQGNYNADYQANTVRIHHKATWLKNGEGTLFTVWVFQTRERAEEYKEIADMIGMRKVYEDDNQIIGISTPTDVQYILDDKQLRDQYAQMEKDISRIARSFKKINKSINSRTQ